MSKLTITTISTLDGVMQAPGGPGEDDSSGFRHGGWLVPDFHDHLGKFMSSVFDRVDAFLLGRGTYQISPDTGLAPPTSRSHSPPAEQAP